MPNEDRWTYSAGEHGATVTVYERTPGGPLYIRLYDPTAASGKGGYRRRSLKHHDRDRAMSRADREAARLREGRSSLIGGKLTLRQLFAVYRVERVRKISERAQRCRKRQMEMWERFLGPDRDPSKISASEWNRFLEQRASGAIDARGRPVPEEAPCPECESGCALCDGTGRINPRKPVGPRTVEKDAEMLRTALRWATRYSTKGTSGRPLLREDPTQAFDDPPTEKNPSRPVASHDRYEALQAVADRVTMQVTWEGIPRTVEGHFGALLAVVNGTGRRISAVCKLHHADLMLEPTEKAPHGKVRW